MKVLVTIGIQSTQWNKGAGIKHQLIRNINRVRVIFCLVSVYRLQDAEYSASVRVCVCYIVK